jgi:RNA polymerase sigma factor (sigma-70 family)
MDAALARHRMVSEQNQQIADAVRRESGRLRAFIRRRVRDDGETEDILQDVLYELVAAYRRVQPLEEVGAWLFRVARNRVIDFFRRKRPVEVQDAFVDDAERPVLDELLLPADEAPDTALSRQLLLEQLSEAVEELPREQRDVFIAHEIEGLSFKDMAARTGISLNTLLARKHYAVKHLRRRLQGAYDDWFQD